MLDLEPSLGRGNIKIGRIPSFSLPSRFTCPGASSWCLKKCYAARYERLRSKCRFAYSRNLMLSWDPRRFVKTMLNRIPPKTRYFRIHVSGDFYSAQYIQCWHKIVRQRPNTQFWAYTRSWSVKELKPALERLRTLPNMHLFASVDSGMPNPPKHWRKAFLDIDARAQGLPCLHQNGKAKSCAECRYCFRPGKGNVVFKVH